MLLGLAIWILLPAKVSACKLLSSEEQQHLQAAISGTIPPAACTTTEPQAAAKGASEAGEAGQQTPTVVKAVTHDGDRTSSCSNRSGGASGNSVVTGSLSAARDSSREGVLAAGLKQVQQDGPPSRQQLLADLAAAASCRVVWCASGWRFLYLLCLNGLVYW